MSVGSRVKMVGIVPSYDDRIVEILVRRLGPTAVKECTEDCDNFIRTIPSSEGRLITGRDAWDDCVEHSTIWYCPFSSYSL